MVTSEKLAVRTYPGIQELHSKLKTLTDSLSLSQISHPPELLSFSHRFRRQLYLDSFDSIFAVVEKLLAQDDPQYELSADARIALRTTLSNAHHFVAVILPLFYDCETLLFLFDSKQHIDDVYGQYGHHLLSASQLYPRLTALWTEIGNQKKKFRTIVERIISKKFWKNPIIHRVSDGEDESMSHKRAVFNPTNLSDYPEDKFYKMYSETSYVVDSTTNQVEYHLFVSVDCRLTDDEIKVMVAKRNATDFLDENWFRGAHILNLHHIRQVKEWMEEVAPALIESVSLCKHVQRSKNREDRQVAKDTGSRMIATGVHVDQHGYLRPPHNTGKMDENLRFDLMQANDHILDGVVFVNSLFSFSKANVRLQKRSSLGCFNTGRFKESNIMLLHLVCSPFLFLFFFKKKKHN